MFLEAVGAAFFHAAERRLERETGADLVNLHHAGFDALGIKEAYALDVHQQCCGGLNFGYYYDGSPIIAYDDESPPGYTMGTFTSSTIPGCRAPHFWLEGRRSLYDALSAGYTLLRLDPGVRIDGLVEAAGRRGFPLTVLDVEASGMREAYSRKLVLVRPDQHVAWRGDTEPAAPLDLVDRLRGGRPAS